MTERKKTLRAHKEATEYHIARKGARRGRSKATTLMVCVHCMAQMFFFSSCDTKRVEMIRFSDTYWGKQGKGKKKKLGSTKFDVLQHDPAEEQK